MRYNIGLWFRRVRLVAALVGAVALSGCLGPVSSPTARFYQLQPAAPEGDAGTLKVDAALSVGPVEIAPYLERRAMVLRSGAHELSYDERHRWAEPLRKNIGSVLIENLVNVLRTDDVFPYAAVSAYRREFGVPVRIVRMERQAGNVVLLHAAWSVIPRDAERAARVGHARLRRALAEDADPAAAVAAQSALLAELSVRIAEDIVRCVETCVSDR